MKRSLLLTVLLLLSTVTPAIAQPVRTERPTALLIDLLGPGTPPSWRMQLGGNGTSFKSALLVLSDERAYFSLGPWLRLIDTKKGVVLGRWRFPNLIDELTPAGGGAINVRFRLAPDMRVPELNVRFDGASSPPQWDIGALASYRSAELEAFNVLKTLSPVQDPWQQAIPGAAKGIPIFEDLVRRDPFAPYLRLALAKLLRDAGDARAEAAFQDVFAVKIDFTEGFRISTILDRLTPARHDLATTAFDRAMSDFVHRDRDPRLIEAMIPRLILFPPGNLGRTGEPERRLYLERLYQLTPMGEGTERAWPLHARELERQGDSASALWRQRADETWNESLNPFHMAFQRRHDQFLLIAWACLAAAIIFIITRYVKYHMQRRMRAIAAMRDGRPEGVFFIFGFRFWTGRERWTLVLILAAGWLAIGMAWGYARVLHAGAALNLHIGMFNSLERFEKYPDSPERTLVQALANQSSGDIAEAEKLYRATPQFAESWNNLGVIQARDGRADDSRQSFARALQIDPGLPEALLNTTGEARTSVTQNFKKYAPEAKMIAVPSRDRLFTAYMGNAWQRMWIEALKGPLSSGAANSVMRIYGSFWIEPAAISGLALLVLMVMALGLLVFGPMDAATVPPGRVSAALDWLIPGTSSAWGWGMGPLLTVWSLMLLTLVLQLTIASPYILFSLSQRGLMRAFGYDVGLEDVNPPLIALIIAAIAAWIANFTLLRVRGRRPLR